MTFSTLNLLLVLVAAFAGGRIAVRIGYPAVLGEIIMGIALGPPLLGLLHASDALMVLADLGVLLMMMFVGMEVDLKELRRSSKGGLYAALGGFIIPFALGVAVLLLWGEPLVAALFVGVAMGVTSLATKSRILTDLGILDTRIASVMMAGALVADTLSLLFFASILGVAEAGTLEPLGTLWLFARVCLFFVASWVLGLYVIPPLYRWLRRRDLTSRTFNATLALIIALAFAELAELAGLHGILGAFLAGLFLREAISERRLSHELTELVRDVSIGFLAPIFFLTVGFEVSFGVLQTSLGLLLTVIVVATVSKIVGTLLFYLLSGGSWREGLVIGMGMNDRGAVEIILAGIALRAGLISNEVFSILVIMAVVTTATVPLLLTWGVSWLSKRGELSRAGSERQGVVIVGAGPVARILARELSVSRPVTLLDTNQTNCEEAERMGLRAVYGDALEDSPLLDADIEQAGLFIGLTPNAEVNVLALKRVGEEFSVPERYALLTRESDGGLFRQLERTGAHPLFANPVNLLEWDHDLLTEQAQELLYRIEGDKQALEGADATLLPLVIRREQGGHLFRSVQELQAGDEVVAIQRG